MFSVPITKYTGLLAKVDKVDHNEQSLRQYNSDIDNGFPVLAVSSLHKLRQVDYVLSFVVVARLYKQVNREHVDCQSEH